MNIKRLVLGTAAGALAVTGASTAQAADLPVAVDPVDFVRICDAYGRGYYFIPGTETCIRLAGRVRADYNIFFDSDEEFDRPGSIDNDFDITLGGGEFINRNIVLRDVDGDGAVDDPGDDDDDNDGDGFADPFTVVETQQGDFRFLGGRGGFIDEDEDTYRFRARGYIYLESRTATEFGLLRTFTEVQFTRDNNSGTDVNLDSAVIQFGGLIFGRTDSLYDFNDADLGAAQFFGYFHSDSKVNLIGYQAAFGNGFSAAISLEDHETRAQNVFQATGGGINTGFVNVADRRNGAGNANGNAIDLIPDIVGNLRVDQGWGSAQIMAAGHQVTASGITAEGLVDTNGDGILDAVRADQGLFLGDGTDEEYGFAIGAGVAVNVPFGNGTTFALTGTYAHGAIEYAIADGNDGLLGYADAVIDENGDIELVDVFSISAGIETSFTPTISAALQAGYANIDHEEIQLDIGGGTAFESLDSDAFTLDGFLGYSPVSGMTFGVGAQWLYQDTDDFGDANAVSTFFRAQRTF